MIKGIGVDIIEIERIAKAIENKAFVERIYTNAEIAEMMSSGNRAENYAGKYAAKEAISKALGTGIGKVSFQDIEILHDDMGKPIAKIKDKDLIVHISISHSRENAVAYVILEE